MSAWIDAYYKFGLAGAVTGIAFTVVLILYEEFSPSIRCEYLPVYLDSDSDI